MIRKSPIQINWGFCFIVQVDFENIHAFPIKNADILPAVISGGCGARTHDLLRVKQALSRLS